MLETITYVDHGTKREDVVVLTPASMYQRGFARAIVGRVGRHLDPVPGFGLVVDFSKTARGAEAVITKGGEKLASLDFSNEIVGSSTVVHFRPTAEHDRQSDAVKTGVAGICQACALAWAEQFAEPKAA